MFRFKEGPSIDEGRFFACAASFCRIVVIQSCWRSASSGHLVHPQFCSQSCVFFSWLFRWRGCSRGRFGCDGCSCGLFGDIDNVKCEMLMLVVGCSRVFVGCSFRLHVNCSMCGCVVSMFLIAHVRFFD